jgi:predicted molibdopterin-dependent oxidoreductase YjgC
MFKPIAATDTGQRVRIDVDGRSLSARLGLPLAIALLEADIAPLRHTLISGAPRAPLCLMGVCFDCLVEVDGRRNVQSCMIEVVEGMSVRLSMDAQRAESRA